MAIQHIASTNIIKKTLVKFFKDKYSASKVTNVKFDTEKHIYTANCFQKFNFLGNKIITAEEFIRGWE